jgi:sialate O-acetylesterase
MGIALVALAAPMAGAAVSLPAVLGEHMVVQRDVPFHVWGQASPGEAVTASFRGATRSAVADDLGRVGCALPVLDRGALSLVLAPPRGRQRPTTVTSRECS